MKLQTLQHNSSHFMGTYIFIV